jgi:uncharacterized protein YhhL (DUF1145 family)
MLAAFPGKERISTFRKVVWAILALVNIVYPTVAWLMIPIEERTLHGETRRIIYWMWGSQVMVFGIFALASLALRIKRGK